MQGSKYAWDDYSKAAIDSRTEVRLRKLVRAVRGTLRHGNHDFARSLVVEYTRDTCLDGPSLPMQWRVFGVVVALLGRIDRAPVHVVVTPGGHVFEAWAYRGDVQPESVRRLHTRRRVSVDDHGGVWVAGKRLETRVTGGSQVYGHTYALVAGGHTIPAETTEGGAR